MSSTEEIEKKVEIEEQKRKEKKERRRQEKRRKEEEEKKEIEEIAARYEAKPRPACPKCKSDQAVAFVVRGKPNTALLLYSEQPNSRVELGGCDSSSKFGHYCKACAQGFKN